MIRYMGKLVVGKPHFKLSWADERKTIVGAEIWKWLFFIYLPVLVPYE